MKSKKEIYGDPNHKPDVLRVNPDGIPSWLKELPRWVLWRLEWKTRKDGTGGKWDKPLLRPSGVYASSTDPATWSAFADVIAAYRQGGFDGVGVVLGGGLAGIDTDETVDPETHRVIAPWAADLIRRADAYSEISPSGTGAKLFGFGTWSGDWNKRPHPSGVGEIEVYDGGRYFTATGVPVGGLAGE